MSKTVKSLLFSNQQAYLHREDEVTEELRMQFGGTPNRSVLERTLLKDSEYCRLLLEEARLLELRELANSLGEE